MRCRRSSDGDAGARFVLAGELKPGRISAADVVQLRSDDMQIGSHGLHHRDWRAIPDDELRRELAGSRRALSNIIDAEVDEITNSHRNNERAVRSRNAITSLRGGRS